MRTLVGTLPPDPDPDRRPSRQRLGVVQYLREVVSECRKLDTPMRSEVLTYSAVSVLWAAGVTSLVLGLDVLFTEGILRTLGL